MMFGGTQNGIKSSPVLFFIYLSFRIDGGDWTNLAYRPIPCRLNLCSSLLVDSLICAPSAVSSGIAWRPPESSLIVYRNSLRKLEWNSWKVGGIKRKSINYFLKIENDEQLFTEIIF